MHFVIINLSEKGQVVVLLWDSLGHRNLPAIRTNQHAESIDNNYIVNRHNMTKLLPKTWLSFVREEADGISTLQPLPSQNRS